MFLEIKNVEMKYDKFEAVKGVSFEVAKGSIHGLIGENGSGKTTLIKCIMGIFKPNKGEILLEDEKIYENPEVKKRIGYIADSNKYFPTYKAGKMAEFFSEVYGKFDMNKFKELNQIFKLDMNKRVGEFSKGQQMRLAFMLNIAANTDVLVMDEPTSGIDAIAKKELFQVLVKEVEERELTVLITSHNILELERICDSVTMIKNGKVTDCQDGDVRKFNYVFKESAPEEFLNNPKILSISNTGSIYTVIYNGITEEELEANNKLNPVYTEELQINLEEVFVHINGGAADEK